MSVLKSYLHQKDQEYDLLRKPRLNKTEMRTKKLLFLNEHMYRILVFQFIIHSYDIITQLIFPSQFDVIVTFLIRLISVFIVKTINKKAYLSRIL